MSVYLRDVYHPLNGYPRKVYGGWSWPAFFFGPFWYASKDMWGWAVLWFIIQCILWVVALGWVTWIIAGAIGNKQHLEHLLKQGYVSKSGSTDRDRTLSLWNPGASQALKKTCPNCGKEISEIVVSCPHCGSPVKGPVY